MHYYKTYINNKLMNHINTDSFFGFSWYNARCTNINQIMTKQKNYDDLIINKRKYTYSNEQ